MIRLGVSGTNWTGKTSTLKAVLYRSSPDHTLISLSQIVHRCPFPTGKHQTLDASKWVLCHLYEAEVRLVANTRTVWYDRTSLDILAYTLYAHELGSGADDRTFNHLMDTIIDHMRTFSRIFYAPVDPSWPHGHRLPEEVRFATLMEGYLRRAAGYGSNVQELPVEIEGRLDSVKQFVSVRQSDADKP